MKLIFEYLTSSFVLFGDPIRNYLVMAIIGSIAFSVAYSVVGDFYSLGLINGRESGHVLHWIIRLIVFVVIFYVFATIIRIYNWFSNLPEYKWWVVGAIVALVIIGASIIKYICNKAE